MVSHKRRISLEFCNNFCSHTFDSYKDNTAFCDIFEKLQQCTYKEREVYSFCGSSLFDISDVEYGVKSHFLILSTPLHRYCPKAI